jgi:starch-binding outer membrane protein, SusD/RagB family
MTSRTLTAIAAGALSLACESPLNTQPVDAIDAETALSTPRGIELAVAGAYRSLQAPSLYSQEEMAFADMYADNLNFTGTFPSHREFWLRNLSANNTSVRAIWRWTYEGINRTNNILDAIPRVAELTPAQRAGFRGEALFIRALHYSILVRDFGDVPIVTWPSRGIDNSSYVSRDPRDSVHALIRDDLEEAATLLSTGRIAGRATRGASLALLARTYLEWGKHAEARDRATLVIGDPGYSLVPTFAVNVAGAARTSMFATKHGSESIFELEYGVNNPNSHAFMFFTTPMGGRWGYSPTAGLYGAFEAGDQRRDASIGIDASNRRYGNKYFRIANGDDNVIVLRLAEMYLIRAEANARLDAAASVVRADVNVIRNRAGLGNLPTTVTSVEGLLAAILHERRVEFAFEGHRFFDLRRMGLAGQLLGMTSDRLLYPIPQAEMDMNPNLTQNPGY